MHDTLNWLIETEGRAERIYSSAAASLTSDKALRDLLKRLASDERSHLDFLVAARKDIERIESGLVATLGRKEAERIESFFDECEQAISSRSLNEAKVLEFMANAEFSEWNDIFIYMARSAGRARREFIPNVTAMQAHKRRIEEFLDKSPGAADLARRVRELFPVWKEKILVVDDEESIRDVLEAILETEGLVVKASNGKAGLEALRSGYYAAIITDVDMNVMNGMEFYEKAVAEFPGIKERFLFFSAEMRGPRADFFAKTRVRALPKPSPIRDIREAVVGILLKR